MKQARRLTILISCLSLLLVGGARAQSETPEIRSLDPEHGSVGEKITIRGRDFSPDEDENIVFFGVLQAEVTKAKRKKLVVIVPEGLAPGTYAVTVSVGGRTSNAVNFVVALPVVPLDGEYLGRTAQGIRFDFEVQENRRVVTRLRTTFTCTTNSCATGAAITSNALSEIEHGRFELNHTNSNFSVRIEGVFLNETEAEGTVEFTATRGCRCSTGRIRWTASLN